jgi:hypothetical protein
MHRHPDHLVQRATEVQRQYQAQAEQRRLLAAASKVRRRHEHSGEMSRLARIAYAVGLRPRRHHAGAGIVTNTVGG